MKALRFVLLVIIIDCGSAFIFGLILLLVGFGQNEKSERGGEGRGGEEVLPRAIIGILKFLKVLFLLRVSLKCMKFELI